MSQEPFIEFMGIFDDDGNRIPVESIPKPSLCEQCLQDDNAKGMEEVLCLLARCGHMLDTEDEVFVCHAFRPKN